MLKRNTFKRLGTRLKTIQLLQHLIEQEAEHTFVLLASMFLLQQKLFQTSSLEFFY